MVVEIRNGVSGKVCSACRHGILYDYSTEIAERQTGAILDARSVTSRLAKRTRPLKIGCLGNWQRRCDADRRRWNDTGNPSEAATTATARSYAETGATTHAPEPGSNC